MDMSLASPASQSYFQYASIQNPPFFNIFANFFFSFFSAWWCSHLAEAKTAASATRHAQQQWPKISTLTSTTDPLSASRGKKAHAIAVVTACNSSSATTITATANNNKWCRSKTTHNLLLLLLPWDQLPHCALAIV